DGAFHFWGEPMYGYYNSRDPWVIKKHIELFTLAGVDFLIFDNTNGAEYIEVLGVMMPIMQELYDQGWNVPKLVMYTNSYSKDVIKRLYYGTGASYEASTAHRKLDQPLDPKYEAVTREITQNGIYGNTGDGGKYQYKDLWFCPNGDGKPMIVGITRPDNTSASDTTQDVKNHMVDDPVLLNFFYFRESTWPNAAVYSTGFPWIDFVHPQVNYGDAINVGVGQHCYNGNVIPFSYTIDNGQYYNGTWGRGANAANHGTSASHSLENIRKGLNFEEQWAVAKARDVRFTYVTGWNEWVALKYWDGSKYIFVDTYSEEFSRDAEMMKGGYEDNFYLSICRNIRSQTGLKGAAARETKNLIDINKGLAQWNGTGKTYVNMVTEKERNYRGFATGKFNYSDPSADLGKVFYLENYSVVNQVTQVRVTHDSEYVYFLIECDDTITPWNSPLNTNDSWLNLLIGVDGVGGSPLHGYNFLAGGSKDASGFASLERLSFDGTTLSKTDRPGDSASYTYNGRYAQYRVKKSSLLLGNNSQFTLRFKVVDNVENLTDIASYYTTGNCAPAGRLSYTFYG
ncbi:MAG: hypothetical protein FWE62_04730, partial [Firmicutes bacterium]|nr:hypothetical protein [Bacillota bacterium]